MTTATLNPEGVRVRLPARIDDFLDRITRGDKTGGEQETGDEQPYVIAELFYKINGDDGVSNHARFMWSDYAAQHGITPYEGALKVDRHRAPNLAHVVAAYMCMLNLEECATSNPVTENGVPRMITIDFPSTRQEYIQGMKGKFVERFEARPLQDYGGLEREVA